MVNVSDKASKVQQKRLKELERRNLDLIDFSNNHQLEAAVKIRELEAENKRLKEVILLAPGSDEKEFQEKYRKWWDTLYREIRSPGSNSKTIERALKGE